MDAQAVQVVEPMVQFFWVSMIAVIPLGIFFSLNRPKENHVIRYLFGGWKESSGSYIIIGTSAYLSYFLMLKAFKMGGEVAALSSIRQASIPISVLIGGLILNEENFVGMKTFGASGPYKDLYKYFEITSENLIKKIKNYISLKK